MSCFPFYHIPRPQCQPFYIKNLTQGEAAIVKDERTSLRREVRQWVGP